ncbi:hypothetical protein BDN72DRAFT_883125 [Pluteus cervinus]|uniref:Uncharacterized protein n=1 Tax=Pluteus cervinus TaxID=181527 RepID=A0ACD3A743_9AGAR|nr:hypothetical protein BDN72DRAFT_883125 [Pluteus cervinus]
MKETPRLPSLHSDMEEGYHSNSSTTAVAQWGGDGVDLDEVSFSSGGNSIDSNPTPRPRWVLKRKTKTVLGKRRRGSTTSAVEVGAPQREREGRIVLSGGTDLDSEAEGSQLVASAGNDKSGLKIMMGFNVYFILHNQIEMEGIRAQIRYLVDDFALDSDLKKCRRSIKGMVTFDWDWEEDSSFEQKRYLTDSQIRGFFRGVTFDSKQSFTETLAGIFKAAQRKYLNRKDGERRLKPSRVIILTKNNLLHSRQTRSGLLQRCQALLPKDLFQDLLPHLRIEFVIPLDSQARPRGPEESEEGYAVKTVLFYPEEESGPPSWVDIRPRKRARIRARSRLDED